MTEGQKSVILCNFCGGSKEVIWDGQLIPCVHCQPKRVIHPRDAKHIAELQEEAQWLTELMVRLGQTLLRPHKQPPEPSKWHPIKRVRRDERMKVLAEEEAISKETFDRLMPEGYKNWRIR